MVRPSTTSARAIRTRTTRQRYVFPLIRAKKQPGLTFEAFKNKQISFKFERNSFKNKGENEDLTLQVLQLSGKLPIFAAETYVLIGTSKCLHRITKAFRSACVVRCAHFRLLKNAILGCNPWKCHQKTVSLHRFSYIMRVFFRVREYGSILQP